MSRWRNLMLINNSIHIDATPGKVWDALEDVERWPDFSPPFKSIVRTDDGPLAMGAKARVTPDGFFGAVWTITGFETGRLFTWEGDMLPGVHLTASHVLEPTSGGTEFRLSLKSTGPLAGPMGLVLGRIFRRNVREEAEGMKQHCEVS